MTKKILINGKLFGRYQADGSHIYLHVDVNRTDTARKTG